MAGISIAQRVPTFPLSLREASWLAIFTQLTIESYVVDNHELVHWFLDQGADQNGRSKIATTCLSHAVRDASMETIKLMFERGGDVTKGALLHHAAE